MQYVRRRRLTGAARVLANGAPNILEVALEAGYSSHEAFTRAFRDLFGVTPEMAREQAGLTTMRFLEPLKMSEDLLTKLEPPRLEDGRTLLIAGMGQRYNSETSAGIPEQWQRFAPLIGQILARVGRDTYGVLCNDDDQGTIEYVSGVEVCDFRGIPQDWRRLTIPKQKYLVFTCRDHISTIRRVWTTIWNSWLPPSPYRVVKGPEFEHYPAAFDPSTGTGGFEIWLPVEE